MSSSPRRPGIHQERDRIPGVWAAIVLAGIALLTAAGIWWALALGRPVSTTRAQPSAPRTEDVRAAREVGGVRVTLFETDSSTKVVREARRRALDQWRWLDSDSGLIQMPVEAAMSLLAEQTRRRPPLDSAMPGPGRQR